MARTIECNVCGVPTNVSKDATGAICWQCVIDNMQKDGTYRSEEHTSELQSH